MDKLDHFLAILDPAPGTDFAVRLNAFALDLGMSELQATLALSLAPEVIDRQSFMACAIGLAKAACGRIQQEAQEAAARADAVAAIAALWDTPVAQLPAPGVSLTSARSSSTLKGKNGDARRSLHRRPVDVLKSWTETRARKKRRLTA